VKGNKRGRRFLVLSDILEHRSFIRSNVENRLYTHRKRIIPREI